VVHELLSCPSFFCAIVTLHLMIDICLVNLKFVNSQFVLRVLARWVFLSTGVFNRSIVVIFQLNLVFF
jgi:hypothetical protein